jgi:hypothetical protein
MTPKVDCVKVCRRLRERGVDADVIEEEQRK